MLTKDLIRARLSGETIKPQFVKTDDPEILHYAEALILLYGEGTGTTAAELDESASALAAAFRDKKLAEGLHKTVRDRAEFSWSRDGENWESIGKELHMIYTIPQFIGYRFALFCNASKDAGGIADFDFFHVGD